MLIILFSAIVYILIGMILYYIMVQFNYEQGDDKDSDDYSCLMLGCMFWFITVPIVLIFYICEQFNNKVFNDAQRRLEIRKIAGNLYKDNQAGKTPLISKKEAYKEAKRIYNSKNQ